MSDIILKQFNTGLATLNNALRTAFFPDGARCFLLKQSQHSGKSFEIVEEITNGSILEFSDFRGQFKLLHATNDASFGDKVYSSSFIAFGVPDSDSEIEVFSIHPDKKDIIPPTVTNSQWKVYVDKVPKQRFLIP